LRTEREPDADFVRPLTGQIRNNAVDSDAGKDERECGENTEQVHCEAASRERVGNGFVHRFHAIHNLLAVRFFYGVANGAQQGVWRNTRAHYELAAFGQQRHEFVRDLHHGKIELRLDGRVRVTVEPPVLDVASNADDLS